MSKLVRVEVALTIDGDHSTATRHISDGETASWRDMPTELVMQAAAGMFEDMLASMVASRRLKIEGETPVDDTPKSE